MIKIKSILIASTIVFASSVFSKANLPPPVEDFVKIEKMAGDAGPFVTKEDFPKGYFLISKNLPFLIGLALYHPASSELNLSKKQIDALVKYKDMATPKLAKKALQIKNLEMELVNEVGIKYESVKATTLYDKVDKIAQLKAELTKAHLVCIEKVKAILTKEQFEELLDYGVVNMF